MTVDELFEQTWRWKEFLSRRHGQLHPEVVGCPAQVPTAALLKIWVKPPIKGKTGTGPDNLD